MATNFIQEGDVVEVTLSANVTKGNLVREGSLIGVALDTATSGNACRIKTKGVFDLAKTSALAISVGDPIYMGATDAVTNKTSASRYYIGVAVADAANPSSTVRVRLSGSMPEAAGS